MNNLTDSFELAPETAKINEATAVLRKALTTEVTGIMLIHLANETKVADKIATRIAMSVSLKYMKAEITPTVGAEEQGLSVISMLHPVLQGKVQAALKLK